MSFNLKNFCLAIVPIALFTLLQSNKLNAQLVCNDHVNVSVDDACSLDNLDVGAFLEADPTNLSDYQLFILQPNGTPIPDFNDLISYVGLVLDFEVVEISTGIKCWGTVALEDKLDPELTCACPLGGNPITGEYDDNCKLKCYQLDLIKNGIEDILSCNYVTDLPFADDNCDNVGDLSWNDEYVPNGCGEWFLRRNYALTTKKYNEALGIFQSKVVASCTYEFLVDSYDIDQTFGLSEISDLLTITSEAQIANTLFLPVNYIEVGCGADSSPAGLVSFFDQAGNPPPSGDALNTSGILNVVENNEGIPYGYPFYFAKGDQCAFHPQKIDLQACNINVQYVDTPLPACGACPDNLKTIRDWVIFDWCENTTTQWSQVIKAVDITPPTINAQDLTVSVNPWECTTNVNLPAPYLLHDNCSGSVTYDIGSLQGVSISGNASTGYVASGLGISSASDPYVFYYTAVDCCGNQSDPITINVVVKDQTPPVAITKQNLVLNLTSLAPDTDGTAKIYAQNLDNGSYDGCTGVHFEIRRVNDNCGIIGNTTFNNDNDPDDDKDDPDNGQYVKFCCSDLEDDGSGGLSAEVEVYIRVWDDANNSGVYGDTDAQGNSDLYNETWAIILVEDKLPSTPFCPDNVILTCDMDVTDLSLTGTPEFYSTCSQIPWDSTYMDDYATKRATDAPELNQFLDNPVVPPFDPVCRTGAIKRTIGGCTQWIIVEDNNESFDPNSINFPSDKFVDCLDFGEDEPTWTEVRCQLIGYTVDPDTFYFEPDACFKVLNEYTVINWCEYNPNDADLNTVNDPNNNDGVFDPTTEDDGIVPGIWKWTQIIKLFDDIDPTLSYTGEDCYAVNDLCESDDIVITLVGDDEGDCASEWIKWDVQFDIWANGEYEFVYSSNLLPTDPFYVSPTARQDTLSLTLPAGIEVSKIDHKMRITANDGCGNRTSYVETFKITDKKKPVPYCVNLSTAVMNNGEVEVWAIDFDRGSFDNCTAEEDIRFTFTDVLAPPQNDAFYAGQDWYDGSYWFYNNITGEYALGYGTNIDKWNDQTKTAGRLFTLLNSNPDVNGFISVPMYVWDQCDNQDFCEVSLRLIDNNMVQTASIAGRILTEDGAALEDAKVGIFSSLPEYPYFVQTDTDGSFLFKDNPNFGLYELTTEKDFDYLNGVSTLDLVIIQKHILGLESLDSGYKKIAADVNNDNRLSSIDLIEIRKLILGIYDEFPFAPSWKFIHSSNVINDNDPWDYNQTRTIEGLVGDMLDENYIAIKSGDVNLNRSLNLNDSSIDFRNRKTLDFILESQEFKIGQEVTLDIKSENFEEIIGFQFTLNTPGLEILKIIPGAISISESNYSASDDFTSFSWNAVDAKSFDKDQVLFTLVLNANENGNTLESFISSEHTNAEAYNGQYEVFNLNLKESKSSNIFEIQNVPNPFSDNTEIYFDLIESSKVSLLISDINGKTIYSKSNTFQEGTNSFSISKADLGVTGVYYYTIEYNGFNQTKKMILL